VSKTFSQIPFRSVTRTSDTLEFGLRKVVQEGVEGLRQRSYRAIYENGQLKGRTFTGATVARPPREKITLVGARFPAFSPHGNAQEGTASWYAVPGLTTAHRSLPFGTVVRVTNLDNGRRVTVVIRDRGPYAGGRIIDLSEAAFRQLSPLERGTLRVKIEW
jgi:rare lipoprotein A (peptidoglycan hydrolase)